VRLLSGVVADLSVTASSARALRVVRRKSRCFDSSPWATDQDAAHLGDVGRPAFNEKSTFQSKRRWMALGRWCCRWIQRGRGALHMASAR